MEKFKKVLSVIWIGVRYICKAIYILIWPVRKSLDWIANKLAFRKSYASKSLRDMLWLIGDPHVIYYWPTFIKWREISGMYTQRHFQLSFLMFAVLLSVTTKRDTKFGEETSILVTPDEPKAVKKTATKKAVTKKDAPSVKKTPVKKTASKKK